MSSIIKTIPFAFSDGTMRVFKELNSSASAEYRQIQLYKTERELNIDIANKIEQDWLARKKEHIDLAKKEYQEKRMGPGHRMYQAAVLELGKFNDAHREIFKKYDDLKYYYDDVTDFRSIFDNKTKAERYRERHIGVFIEHERLCKKVSELSRFDYSAEKESAAIRSIEETYAMHLPGHSSVLTERYGDFIDKERKEKYNLRLLQSRENELKKWRYKYLSNWGCYLVKDLCIAIEGPNVYHISCKKGGIGDFTFISYDELVLNGEIKIQT